MDLSFTKKILLRTETFCMSPIFYVQCNVLKAALHKNEERVLNQTG